MNEKEIRKLFSKKYKNATIIWIDTVNSGETLITAKFPEGYRFIIIDNGIVSECFDTYMQARLKTKQPYPINSALVSKRGTFYYYTIYEDNSIEITRQIDKPVMNFPGSTRTRTVKQHLNKEIAAKMKKWYDIEVHEK
jgi:hypothetical protein